MFHIICLLFMVASRLDQAHSLSGTPSVTTVLDPSVLSHVTAERINVTVGCSAEVTGARSYRRNNYRYNNYNRGSTQDHYVIDRMSILMSTGKPNDWISLAELSAANPSNVHSNTSYKFHVITGEIFSRPDIAPSKLGVTLEVPILDAANLFKCDAIYYDQNYQSTPRYKSSEIRMETKDMDSTSFANTEKFVKKASLQEITNTSNELNETYSNMRDRWIAEKDKIRQRILSLKSKLEEALTKRKQKIQALQRDLQNAVDVAKAVKSGDVNNVASSLDVALAGSFLMLWPAGSYAFPEPNTGCPSYPESSWAKEWLMHHTESTDRNNDEVSPVNHLVQPVLSRRNFQNVVFQHFCVKEDSKLAGPQWPSGSYCVNKVYECPEGFSEGSVSWDQEDDNVIMNSSASQRISTMSESAARQYYCCRNDGPSSTPVDLPKLNSFYLYRYGGKCQRVAGMNVTEEFVIFDTENSSNADKAKGDHPDVELNDIRLNLCYYTQNTQ